MTVIVLYFSMDFGIDPLLSNAGLKKYLANRVFFPKVSDKNCSKTISRDGAISLKLMDKSGLLLITIYYISGKLLN